MDYVPIFEERTFNSGDRLMCVSIIILNDTIVEVVPEVFTVFLMGPISTPSAASVTIIDNDEGMYIMYRIPGNVCHNKKHFTNLLSQ